MSGLITVDEFRQRIDDSKVKCSECGFKGHSLVEHLRDVHNMSPGQYKKKHPSDVLVSPIVSELLRTIPRKARQTDAFEAFVAVFETTKFEDVMAGVKKMLPASDDSLKKLVPERIDNFFFEPEATKALVYGLQSGKNIYLEGPTGSGKTELAMQIHAQTGRALKRVNMNGDVTTSNFIGQRQVDPTKGTYFDYGNLPKAMKGGYPLLIDEIDYMPPAIAAVLNSVAEGKKMLYIPETDETIHAVEGFQIIATANTGGKGDMTGVYSGTEILNTALLDRFAIKLTLGYLEPKMEASMLESRFPNSDVQLIAKLVKAAAEVRSSFLNGTLPFTISTRKLIDILDMEGSLGLKTALACAVLNWMDDDNRQVVIQILDRCGVKA